MVQHKEPSREDSRSDEKSQSTVLCLINSIKATFFFLTTPDFKGKQTFYFKMSCSMYDDQYNVRRSCEISEQCVG